MPANRRSLSLGKGSSPPQPRTSLPSRTTLSKMTPWTQNSYSHNKAIALKSIINDYFNDESTPLHQQQLQTQYQQLQPHRSHNSNHQPGRRTHRYRKHQLAPLAQIQKLGDQDLPKTTGGDFPLPKTSTESKTSTLAKTYTLGWSQSKSNHLPPIDETAEEVDHPQALRQSSFTEQLFTETSFMQSSQTESILLRSSSGLSQTSKPEAEEKRLLTFENEIFRVFVCFKGGRPVSRIKEFKELGIPVLERELRILALNLPRVWYESTQNPYTLEARVQSPLKEELCKISYDSNVNPQRDQTMKVRPKPLFKRIAANGFQELRALLRGLCRDLKTVEGKVINNKVTPENIFLSKDYRLCLGEWGYSSFRDCFNTQATTFESRVEPLLRGNQGWFTSPEYLSPETISQMLGRPSEGIWSAHASPSDIWSLGLSVFELMTLVPLWCSKCLVSAKTDQFPTIKVGERTGMLGECRGDLAKLHKRQMSLNKRISAEVEEWTAEEQKLGQLVVRMVEPQPSLRISLDQLIAQL